MWRKSIGQDSKSKVWGQVSQGSGFSNLVGKAFQESISLSVEWGETVHSMRLSGIITERMNGNTSYLHSPSPTSFARLTSALLSASVCWAHSPFFIFTATSLILSFDRSLSQKLYLLFYGNLFFFKLSLLEIIKVIHACYKFFFLTIRNL